MRTSILHTCFHLPPYSRCVPLLSMLAVKQGCGQELYMSGGCMSNKKPWILKKKQQITRASTNNLPTEWDSLALLIDFFLLLLLLLFFLAWPHYFFPQLSSYLSHSTSTRVSSPILSSAALCPHVPIVLSACPRSHLGWDFLHTCPPCLGNEPTALHRSFVFPSVLDMTDDWGPPELRSPGL